GKGKQAATAVLRPGLPMDTAGGKPSSGTGAGAVSLPARQLSWLEGELTRWQAQGRIDAGTAVGIRAQYTASRRFSLARLLLALGGAFVGVGLIWLVAANVEQLSPVTRFAGVTVFWLGAVAGAELLATPGRQQAPSSGGATVGAVRLVAALAFGAVVFQAAQSLQVPAYDSGLLGAWAAGALLYAYAAGAVAPLLVGILTGVGWYVWAVTERTASVGGAVVALLLAAVLATAVAVVHTSGWQPGFAPPWRLTGALLALGGLFLAALPHIGRDGDAVSGVVWAGAAAVLLAAAVAAFRADRTGRLELAAVLGAGALALLLLRWQPPGADRVAELSGEALLRAVAAILVYLLAAAWFAVLGVLRDAGGLTQLATGGLVVFTVVQSFAVFEPILSGAALFLALGAVLAGTGYLVDRGRRRLVADVAEVTT
ncbi:MAG: DUF2157 domain-containing protein, partial [Mycobacteriales bacterium]